MYSQGTSMPNPPPLFTAFPHTLTIPLAPGFSRKCRKSPTPSVVLANLNGTCPTTRLFLTTETAFLSFGFSGSGTSCKVSPFLGVHHPWYTWNPLIHERKLTDWLLAMSCSVLYWTKTFRNPIALDTKLPELKTFFVVSASRLLSFVVLSVSDLSFSFRGVNVFLSTVFWLPIITCLHFDVSDIQYGKMAKRKRKELTLQEKSRCNCLQRQKSSDRNSRTCREVSMW